MKCNTGNGKLILECGICSNIGNVGVLGGITRNWKLTLECNHFRLNVLGGVTENGKLTLECTICSKNEQYVS